jgi:hypothetical protein
MNGVVSSFGRCNEEFRVNDPFLPMTNIVSDHRIDVMDKDFGVNVVAFDAEVTSIIPHNYVSPSGFPLMRLIEPLVKVPIESERTLANFPG